MGPILRHSSWFGTVTLKDATLHKAALRFLLHSLADNDSVQTVKLVNVGLTKCILEKAWCKRHIRGAGDGLTALHLCHNRLTDSGLLPLLRALKRPLRHLSLQNCGIRAADNFVNLCTRMASRAWAAELQVRPPRQPRFPLLPPGRLHNRTICVARYVGGRHRQGAKRAPTRDTWTLMRKSGRRSTFSGASEIGAYFMRCVCYRFIKYTEVKYKAIAASKSTPKVLECIAAEELNVSENKLGRRGQQALKIFLATSSALRILDVSDCEMNLWSIFDSMQQNRQLASSLAYVDVSRNRLGPRTGTPPTLINASARPDQVTWGRHDSVVPTLVVRWMATIFRQASGHTLGLFLKAATYLRILLMRGMHPGCAFFDDLSQLLHGPIEGQREGLHLDISSSRHAKLPKGQRAAKLHWPIAFIKEARNPALPDAMLPDGIDVARLLSCNFLHLKELHLAGGPSYRLGHRAVPLIEALTFNSSLTFLNLEGNKASCPCLLRACSEERRFPRAVASVCCDFEGSGDPMALALHLTLQRNDALRVLHVDGNDFSTVGMKALIQGLQARHHTPCHIPFPVRNMRRLSTSDALLVEWKKSHSLSIGSSPALSIPKNHNDSPPPTSLATEAMDGMDHGPMEVAEHVGDATSSSTGAHAGTLDSAGGCRSKKKQLMMSRRKTLQGVMEQCETHHVAIGQVGWPLQLKQECRDELESSECSNDAPGPLIVDPLGLSACRKAAKLEPQRVCPAQLAEVTNLQQPPLQAPELDNHATVTFDDMLHGLVVEPHSIVGASWEDMHENAAPTTPREQIISHMKDGDIRSRLVLSQTNLWITPSNRPWRT
ncbi:hypothetical protein CYMTET_28466 [Cymbomonas tetramitiformis]|uniref:Uncharacterized protein n=1 Tax=Cymbomonas tetramitiformis TaxID=36881 RepID=A0AAE0FN14_9CHLO|nr:hypothetical protein CYMTET_28466 [Cymbomonas tetramitiformis]